MNTAVIQKVGDHYRLADALRSGPEGRGPGSVVNGITIREMLAGAYAAVATTEDGRFYPVHSGTLQEVIQFAEQMAAHHLLPIDATQIQGPQIQARRTLCRLSPDGEWVNYSWAKISIGDAHSGYQRLSLQGYDVEPDGSLWKAGDEVAISIRSDLETSSIEAESAWEILTHRLKNAGRLPDVGVPADACPQCLSRHVLLLEGSRQCQECLYADT